MMLSALMFGLYHGNLVQAIYGFVLGYLAVYIYEKYGSLKASILFHATIKSDKCNRNRTWNVYVDIWKCS